MQDPQQILSKLHDIQLPEPIGWWPLAFTWWVMIFVVVSIIIGVLWYFIDQRRRNRYRVTAKQRLQDIMLNPNAHDRQKISDINALLKQVALTSYGRTHTASLQSEAWVEFLANNCNYIPQPEHLQEIIQLSYQHPADHADLDASNALNTFHEYAVKWIKGHHQ